MHGTEVQSKSRDGREKDGHSNTDVIDLASCQHARNSREYSGRLYRHELGKRGTQLLLSSSSIWSLDRGRDIVETYDYRDIQLSYFR